MENRKNTVMFLWNATISYISNLLMTTFTWMCKKKYKTLLVCVEVSGLNFTDIFLLSYLRRCFLHCRSNIKNLWNLLIVSKIHYSNFTNTAVSPEGWMWWTLLILLSAWNVYSLQALFLNEVWTMHVDQFSKRLFGGLYSYHSPKQVFWKCLWKQKSKKCLCWNPETQMRIFMNLW